MQRLFTVVLLFFVSGLPSTLFGEVSVLANRTPSELTVQISAAGEEGYSITLPGWSCRPVFYDRMASLRFGSDLAPQSFDLDPGAAYLFANGSAGQALRMEKIGLGPSDLEPQEHAPWTPPARERSATYTIPVKIAVDEDEPTHRSIWEPRLRERIEAASRILEEHCGVKLSVVSVVMWESDDKVRDFSQSMREFERKVPAAPAQLVIGFSSQYDFAVGRMHLGASRGPLYPYIMMKERAPNIREAEKLELLVHELCHFLGASHSPEPTSVMRPVLTTSQLRKIGTKIYIDPVNTLLMSLVGDELRGGQVRTFADVSFPTKRRMMEIYQVLQQALPNDPAAGQYQILVGGSNSTSAQLTMDVREIVAQLTQFAKMENARARKAGIELAGDDLTAKYVCEAAAIASELHTPDATKAMLLALGIFMDDSSMLRSFPSTSSLVTQAENDGQRGNRTSLMGKPSMYGRADLAKHFFVSAHLAVVMGGGAARSAGLAKEVLDANGGSGFSHADMTANRAGIVFAEKLLAGKITLDQIKRSYSVAHFMPEITGLTEGLQAGQLASHVGDLENGLAAELRRTEERILSLPVYQASGP